MPYEISWKEFLTRLKQEIDDDNVFNGAAALAYYLTRSIFPAMIALLAFIPYLPIPKVDQAILDLLKEAMPGEAANAFMGVITEVTQNKKGGLLSFGLLGALWAASNGTFAIMQQLNITYDVKEGRSFLKTRLTAIGLSFLSGILIVSAFSLLVVGGDLQDWISTSLGISSSIVLGLFTVFKWAVIISTMLLAFAFTYYFGPDVEQKFKFITPGSLLGVAALIAASLGFRIYVDNFGDYSATYGSIGAVIVLMLWLYISGLVILLGSEINALAEHYSSEGKEKGEKHLHSTSEQAAS